MYCKKCGCVIKDDKAFFCPKCGTKTLSTFQTTEDKSKKSTHKRRKKRSKRRRQILMITLGLSILLAIGVTIVVLLHQDHSPKAISNDYSDSDVDEIKEQKTSKEAPISALMRNAESVHAYGFNDGYAFVYVDGTFYIINTKGEIVGQKHKTSSDFPQKPNPFYNGVASFGDEVITISGQKLAAIDGVTYDHVIRVTESGLAFVSRTDSTSMGNESSVGVLKPDGHWQVPMLPLKTIRSDKAKQSDWSFYYCGENQFVMRVKYNSFSEQYYYLFDAETGSIHPFDLRIDKYTDGEWRSLLNYALSSNKMNFVNGIAYVYVRDRVGYGYDYDHLIVSLNKDGRTSLVKVFYQNDASGSSSPSNWKHFGGIMNYNGKTFSIRTKEFSGYCDKDGEKIIDLSQYNGSFSMMSETGDEEYCFGKFVNGVANVSVKSPDGVRFFWLIREDGSRVCDEIAVTAFEREFKDGIIGIKLKDQNRIRYLNQNGETVAEFYCNEGIWAADDIRYGGNGIFNDTDNYYNKNGDILFGRDA